MLNTDSIASSPVPSDKNAGGAPRRLGAFLVSEQSNIFIAFQPLVRKLQTAIPLTAAHIVATPSTTASCHGPTPTEQTLTMAVQRETLLHLILGPLGHAIMFFIFGIAQVSKNRSNPLSPSPPYTLGALSVHATPSACTLHAFSVRSIFSECTMLRASGINDNLNAEMVK